ncbi:UDP-2,3-diacylglucosamine diphosphatase [Simiduia agarivorans]|uniref:UDP-2,3-diacylglucosamine hydrolase n=1 Tax=Simiduia agarivorans (strain DSM 21679 / JCM 13881 / BCRC 17597 / SA1) TaxID=1117647 RepID=K4KGK6_SIMAS|nr:UDP-2,3-diacylglucosamine diphosphatase [Simiduia agarivorans]AFU97330.1 UDP-2,3-diacylglucosamine hydrolase [Simiduia agarivorans SA1 = DSM 21679]
MTTLFISDLHLDAKRPAITRAFLQFLTEEAQAATALYILGDLFEAWIGDDDDAPLALEVQAALKAYSDGGKQLFFMAGNRDFLIGDDFCANTGATLLTDPTPIDLYDRPTLLLHGDTLCTDDVEYQAFRAQARNPAWQAPLLAQPLPVRRQLAEKIRAETRSLAAMKAEDIMDVNSAEVDRVMQANGVSLMIHGHTHRPARHAVSAGERIVLGDWHTHLWFLRADETSLSLEQKAIEPPR